MADLNITAAQVQPSTNAEFFASTSEATITAGQVCYNNTATSKINLADADNTSTTATVKGIALNSASNLQPLKLQTAGTIIIGASAAITAGTVFVLSDTAGGIKPATDLSAGDYVSIIGVGDDSDGIVLGINNSGVEVT